MDPAIEKLGQDPVMGRAIRELGAPLAEIATGQTPPTNGNDNYSGQPVSGERLREVTQDKHSDQVPSYELPGVDRGAAEAAQAREGAAGGTLRWHNQLVEKAELGAPAPDHAAAREVAATRDTGPTVAATNWAKALADPEVARVKEAVAQAMKDGPEQTRQGESPERDQPDPGRGGRGR